MAAVRWHIVAIMSDSHLYPKIASVSDSLDTPSVCSCFTPMHNSTMSSSLNEGAGTQWSVITLAGDQDVNSVPYIYFITQIWVHFHWNSFCGCGWHISKENINLAKSCRVMKIPEMGAWDESLGLQPVVPRSTLKILLLFFKILKMLLSLKLFALKMFQ